ncbi:hypothetical protein D3C81_1408890 [compost metagenome]
MVEGQFEFGDAQHGAVHVRAGGNPAAFERRRLYSRSATFRQGLGAGQQHAEEPFVDILGRALGPPSPSPGMRQVDRACVSWELRLVLEMRLDVYCVRPRAARVECRQL